jgi:hypothetical protein
MFLRLYLSNCKLINFEVQVMSSILFKNDSVCNNIQGDVSHSSGIYVTFYDVPESQWLDLISQGYSPAMNIYHASNGFFRGLEGFNLYKFGIAPYIF